MCARSQPAFSLPVSLSHHQRCLQKNSAQQSSPMLRVLGCLRPLLGSQGNLHTWDPPLGHLGYSTRTTSGLGGRLSTPWPRAIFSQCSSSVKLDYSLMWLTARKDERKHQHPWISFCFNPSIIYQIIEMKHFVYFKIFFPIFPSLRDPIRDSCSKSKSRIYILQYVMNFSWRESPAFIHL